MVKWHILFARVAMAAVAVPLGSDETHAQSSQRIQRIELVSREQIPLLPQGVMWGMSKPDVQRQLQRYIEGECKEPSSDCLRLGTTKVGSITFPVEVFFNRVKSDGAARRIPTGLNWVTLTHWGMCHPESYFNVRQRLRQTYTQTRQIGSDGNAEQDHLLTFFKDSSGARITLMSRCDAAHRRYNWLSIDME